MITLFVFHQHKLTHYVNILYIYTVQGWMLCDLRDTRHAKHSISKELQFSKS